MVLTRCHTISKSIVSYDQLDDVIDSVNDYPLTTVFSARHERLYPKYRREESANTTELASTGHTTKSKEKTIPVTTKTTKRKKITNTYTTETTKPIPAPIVGTTATPSMNLFRRLRYKFGRRNKTALKCTTKKHKFRFHKKHKEIDLKADKLVNFVDRNKRYAMKRLTAKYMDSSARLLSPNERTSHRTPFSYTNEDNISNISSITHDYSTDNQNFDNIDDSKYNTDDITRTTDNETEISEENNPSPFTSPTDKNAFTHYLEDDLDSYSGTADIESLLNKIKLHAINKISEQAPSINEIITNSVTETTFDVDPLLRAFSVTKPTKFEFKIEDVQLAVKGDSDEKKRGKKKRDATQTEDNKAITLPEIAPICNFEYKLQREMKYALTKAKNTLTGGLNRARDQVKSVTWKIMHNTAHEISDIANKLKTTQSKEAVTSQKPPLPIARPAQTQPTQLETPTTSTEVTTKSTPSSTKISTETMTKTTPKVQATTRQNRGTTTAETKEEEKTVERLFDDYSMLKFYEKALTKDTFRDSEDNVLKMLTTSIPVIKMLSIKDKVSKRDTETIEDLNLKENIRKINNGEGMPDADYNSDYQKHERSSQPNVEVYNEGNPFRVAETTIRELASPDMSFAGLTSKIHYNEYVNGYKHYLNFAKELSKLDQKFSNSVCYQAHLHHSVDDIGKFILTRLPPIPDWKSFVPANLHRRDKRLFSEDLNSENTDTTTKSEESWFRRHFYIFHDSKPQKKFHTKETVTLRNEEPLMNLEELRKKNKDIIWKDNSEQKNVDLTWKISTEISRTRELGEKEGFVFQWKSAHLPNMVAQSSQKPETTLIHWDSSLDSDQDEIGTTETTGKSLTYAKEQNLTETSTEATYSTDIKPNSNLNDLMKKISNDSVNIAISEITPQAISPSGFTQLEGTTSVDELKEMLAKTSTTAEIYPTSDNYLNELVSALILYNYTTENDEYKKRYKKWYGHSLMDSPRHVINKLLYKSSRRNTDDQNNNGEVTNDEDAILQEISRIKRDRKNSYVQKEEFEHMIKSTIPTDIFEEAALYSSQDNKFDNFGYVDLNLVAKPSTTVLPKTKKNKYKKLVDKLFKKKKKVKLKDKKLKGGKTRKERHSPFKLLKNWFRISSTDQYYNNINLYPPTESLKLIKYNDIEQSIKEFMKQVPNITKDEVTYEPRADRIKPLSSPSNPHVPTKAMAVTQAAGPVAYYSTLPGIDYFPITKKKKYKMDNSNFKYKSSRLAPHPTLRVTLTPVTMEELMKDLRVNIDNNNKYTKNNMLLKTTTDTSQNVPSSPLIIGTSRLVPSASKMTITPRYDDLSDKDIISTKEYPLRFYMNNDTTTNSFDNDFRKYGIQFHDIKNFLNMKDKYVPKNFQYKHDDKNVIQLFSIKSHDRDGFQLNDLKNNLRSKEKQSAENHEIPNISHETDNRGFANVPHKDDKKESVLRSFSNYPHDKDENKNNFLIRGFVNYPLDKDGSKDDVEVHDIPNSSQDYKTDNEEDDEIYDNISNSLHDKDDSKDDDKTHDFTNFIRDKNGMGGNKIRFQIHIFPNSSQEKDDSKYGVQFHGIIRNKDNKDEKDASEDELENHDNSNSEDDIDDNKDWVQTHGIPNYLHHKDDDKDAVQFHGMRNFLQRKDYDKNNVNRHFHSTNKLRLNNDDKTNDIKHDPRVNIRNDDNKNHRDDILKILDMKQQNSALVLQDSDILTETSTYSEMRSTKPYKREKEYNTYPDYFADFFIWNNDILSLDSVTPPAEDNWSPLMNSPTVDVPKLRNEIMQMKNYLKYLTTNQYQLLMLKNSKTTPKMISESSQMQTQTNMPVTKSNFKISKNRRDSINKNTYQSLDQVNEMVSDINKLYHQSFEKYDRPEITTDSVFTTYTYLDTNATEFPEYIDTTLAYNNVGMISDDFGARLFSMPKTVRRRVGQKKKSATKTKVNPEPEQYFRTPVPMQPNEFDKFLKDNNLDISNITSPNNELSDFEEKWERGQHVKSKLMDTRGKHEKFYDLPKELKDLKSINFTPNRVIDNNTNIEAVKYKVSKSKSTAIRGQDQYLDRKELDYTEFKEDSSETDLLVTNKHSNNDDSKREVTNIEATPSLFEPYQPDQSVTNLKDLNFDITIINIDDVLKMSGSHLNEDNTFGTTVAPSSPIARQESNPLLASPPIPKTPEVTNNKSSYNSLDIDPTPSPLDMPDLTSPELEQNTTAAPSDHQKNKHLISKNFDDSHKYQDDSYKYQDVLKASQRELQPMTTTTTSKMKKLIVDNAKTQLFAKPVNNKVKKKLRKGKKSSEGTYLNKIVRHNLHNDLLYHNFNFDNFIRTTKEIEDAYRPKKKTVKLRKNNKPLKKTTIAGTGNIVDDKIADVYKEPVKTFKFTVSPATYTTSRTTTQTVRYLGSDTAPSPKLKPERLATKLMAKPHRKYKKLPKRVMFSSHTMKYDVLYDHSDKNRMNYHRSGTKMQSPHTTEPMKQHTVDYDYDQMTKMSRSIKWNYGKDGEIDVDGIIKEELGGATKGDRRRRRKAMWRKWKSTPHLKPSDKENNEIHTTTNDLHTTKKWYNFIPRMQRTKAQKTPTAPATSTSSISIITTNDSTSPMLLTTTTVSQLSDGKRRDQRSTDSLVYIIDILENKVSSVTATDDNHFPKPGDITFIWPAHVTEDDGKAKLNTSDNLYVEKPWSTTMKRIVAHLKPNRITTPCKANETSATTELARKVCQHEHAIDDSNETNPFNIQESQDSSWTIKNIFGVEEGDRHLVSREPGAQIHNNIRDVFGIKQDDDTQSSYLFPSTTVKPLEIVTNLENYMSTFSVKEKITIPEFNKDVTYDAKYNKEITKIAASCCFGSLDLPTLNKFTTEATNIDTAKLKQEIAKMSERQMESQKCLKNTLSKSKSQKEIEAALDKIEASISRAFPTEATETSFTKKVELHTTDVNKVQSEEKQACQEQKAKAQKAMSDMHNALKEAAKEKSEKAAELAKALKENLKDQQRVEAETRKSVKEAQAAQEKAAARANKLGKQAAKNGTLQMKTTVTTSKTNTCALSNKGNNNAQNTSKLTSSNVVNINESTTIKTPAAVNTSKHMSTTTDMNEKLTSKTSTITTTAAMKPTTKNMAKSKVSKTVKQQKSKLFKRATTEMSNTVYTAKDVAALEVIVDLMKDPSESSPSYRSQNPSHISTNAIQVHIGVPYLSQDKKRAVEASKLRKVFSAKMSVPVDIEYQVRSLDVTESSPIVENNYISPGMYLLVEDTKQNNGFALKPLNRQIKQEIVTSTVKTTSPKNLARVTLSKDYIQSINKQLMQLYQSLTPLDQSTKHTIQKRYEDKSRSRYRRKIKWDKVKEYLGSSDRVCNCKCRANTMMCKACAASDAVMTELLFEFDNLARYMSDHCTEIQTFFWMNPSGGRKLRDIIHQIDKDINDYYKRVRGKCQGRPCNILDKREFIESDIESEDRYIGKPLIDELEDLALSLQLAQKMKLACDEKFKYIVDHLVKITQTCTSEFKAKRSPPEPKKVYSLDNINVNIICNQEPYYSETSTLPYTVSEAVTSDFSILDYTDDEVQKKSRESLTKIFVKRKNLRSHKKHDDGKKLRKRDTIVQRESPLVLSDTGNLWREYLKDANQSATQAEFHPVITLDVLEKTDENTVTFHPSLKATLVKLIPGQNNNTDFNNKMMKLKIFPKRVSRDDDVFSLDDLTTKSESFSESMKELIKLFESLPFNKEVKTTSEFLRNRVTNFTTHTLSRTTQSTPKTKSNKKVEMSASVKTVKMTNKVKNMPYMKVTTVVIPSVKSMTEAWNDEENIKTYNATKISEPSPLPEYNIMTSAKESWFRILKNIVTPGYEDIREANYIKRNHKLNNTLNFGMNANIDVISDITTTSYPTLFIIEDLDDHVGAKNDESKDNLLVKILKYEKGITDKVANIKERYKNNLNIEDEMNDILDIERTKDLRATVTKPAATTNRNTASEVESADGDYCIYNSFKKYRSGWTKPTTPKTTTKKVEAKQSLIHKLLRSMKRNSKKAGQRSMKDVLLQQNTKQNLQQQQPSVPTLHQPHKNQQLPIHSLLQLLQCHHKSLQNPHQPLQSPHQPLQSPHQPLQSPHQHLQSPHQSLQSQHQSLKNPHQPLESDHQLLQNEQLLQSKERDKNNMKWFLAQFASTIICTDFDQNYLSMPSIMTENTASYSIQEISGPTFESLSTDNIDMLPDYLNTTVDTADTTTETKDNIVSDTTVTVYPIPKYLTSKKTVEIKSKKGSTTLNRPTSTLETKSSPVMVASPSKSLNSTISATIKSIYSTKASTTSTKGTTVSTKGTIASTKGTTASTKGTTASTKGTTTSTKGTTASTKRTTSSTEATTLTTKATTPNTLPATYKIENTTIGTTKPVNTMSIPHEGNTTINNNTNKTTSKIDKEDIHSFKQTAKNIIKIKPKTEMNKDIQNAEKKSDSFLKKLLNKELSNKLYSKEACDPNKQVCLCDIGATADHIVDVRRISLKKDFEKYVQNITCYKYKKPPPYYLLEPWKRKIRRHNSQKQRFNKYFDSGPLRWDWIRKKRSLLSINDKGDNNENMLDLIEDKYYRGDTLLQHEDNERTTDPETTNNNKTKIGDQIVNESDDGDIDKDFERMYKGEDNVYRVLRKRLKRTTDMKGLVHGLKNLPPLQTKKNELFAMLGDKMSIDCLHRSLSTKHPQPPVHWYAERSNMLLSSNVMVDGPAVILKNVEARNSGNYTCSQDGKSRTVKLTVVTLPRFHVVFIPMYSSKHGCSYDDLRSLQQRLGSLMSNESGACSPNANSILIDEPICLEDKDDNSVHIRATAILSVCPHPAVRCSVQCRRDIQCAFALLCAANAPVLYNVKVVLARQGYNKSLIPSIKNNRRMIVTHTLRKKELQKHAEYHRLAASMYPGNMDVVVTCPAGFYLLPKQKICAACPDDTYAEAGGNTCYSCPAGMSAEPGAARCHLSLRRMRRYDWWWYPPCGYALAAVGVLGACVLCTACALLAHVTSRSTARAHAEAVSVARVDSRWTWSRRTVKRCSSTSAGVATRREPPSPSAVILARFFRASASSSRATDSQETKFEQWKEKNIPPPLPPIDFDVT